MPRLLQHALRLLEAAWYEAAPYVYIVLGLVSILISNSAPGWLFSALLLAVSIAILCRRRHYRSPESRKYRKYARPR
jgi:hypothetical protein